MTTLLNANVIGLTIVEKPGMHRSGWFLTDEAGLVLRSGVIGMGELKTPSADQDTATTIECGRDLYAALMAHPANAMRRA